MSRKLTPQACTKIVELRWLAEPVTIVNLALRFGVSERTIYYILSQWRDNTSAESDKS